MPDGEAYEAGPSLEVDTPSESMGPEGIRPATEIDHQAVSGFKNSEGLPGMEGDRSHAGSEVGKQWIRTPDVGMRESVNTPPGPEVTKPILEEHRQIRRPQPSVVGSHNGNLTLGRDVLPAACLHSEIVLVKSPPSSASNARSGSDPASRPDGPSVILCRGRTGLCVMMIAPVKRPARRHSVRAAFLP